MSTQQEVDLAELLPPTRGLVAGRRRRAQALARDARLDLALALRGNGRRVDALARQGPSLRVAVAGTYAPTGPSAVEAAVAELRRSRHQLDFALGSSAEARPALGPETVATGLAGGKFENLDRLLDLRPPQGSDWLLLVDDDVVLPKRFLDRFLAVAEAFGLRLAQPALRAASHTAWEVCRRRSGSLVRETAFVEIGPVTALHHETFDALLPFPPVRMGWGLDLHWAALARERGWRLGVVDATPVRHDLRPTAGGYEPGEAAAEAEHFLATHSHLTYAQAAVPGTARRSLP